MITQELIKSDVTFNDQPTYVNIGFTCKVSECTFISYLVVWSH